MGLRVRPPRAVLGTDERTSRWMPATASPASASRSHPSAIARTAPSMAPLPPVMTVAQNEVTPSFRSSRATRPAVASEARAPLKS